MPSVQHGERGMKINWRIFSGLICAALLVVIVLFFATDTFYVRNISVAGLRYLQQEEIYRWADIANTHLFWVNEADVRAAVLQSPAIADAQVTVNWPPNMVRIVVTEREPALIWEQAGLPVWVDLSGRVLMTPPEERPDLLRIFVEGVDEIVTPSTQISPEIVNGALLLRELMPEVTTLRYHPFEGLGFREEVRGWDAWFGSGLDMQTKIAVYKALLEHIQERGYSPREINVTNPASPYYCCVSGQ